MKTFKNYLVIDKEMTEINRISLDWRTRRFESVGDVVCSTLSPTVITKVAEMSFISYHFVIFLSPRILLLKSAFLATIYDQKYLSCSCSAYISIYINYFYLWRCGF